MDVGIFLYDGDFKRLTISHGAVLVHDLNGLTCKNETYVPKTPWLELSDDMTNFFINKTNYSLNVSVGKLSGYIIERLNELNIGECKSPRDIFEIQESSKYLNCVQLLIKYFSKYNYDRKNITQHRLYFCDKSLQNNTFNKHENVYLGMHLDSYEEQQLSLRNNSRNRICLNLGLKSRYLLFYRTSISEMARKINNNSDFQNINDIYQKYMKVELEEPIYRVEVKPFEFYIAPTEAIIHDGSNYPSDRPDINLVFRGRFSYKPVSYFSTIFNLLNL